MRFRRYCSLIVPSTVTGELLEALTAEKTAVTSTYRPGERLTYAISIRNTADTPYTGLTITDNLGAYSLGAATLIPLTYESGSLLYYANGALQATPAVTSEPQLTITGITVPANGNAVLVYTAAANEYASPQADGSITNTAAVTGNGLTAPVTAEETVNASAAAELSVNKAVNPTTVVGNGPLTYTFTVANTGASAITAADNATVTDTFDPLLSITEVTLNGTALTSPAGYSYNATTGEFSTVAGQITIPAATYSQDSATGRWSITPGTAVLTVTGTL